MIGIYVRVSTEEQAKSGFSLQDQIRECRKKAATSEVVEYIDDGITGEILDRPALTKLRNDIGDGIISKVVCLDPDRLSRKLMNQLIISEEIEKHAELIFVNGDYAKTPEGMLFYQMRGAVAEFEKAKINERMSRGRREKARQGKVVKDSKVYGYNFDKEKAQLIVNEQEADVVRLIFDLFINPNGRVNGVNSIAKYLTDRNIQTKRGADVWHRQVVRQILMNQTYTGVFYQNRWNTEGMLVNKHKAPEDRLPIKERPKEEWIPVTCPAIIDESTFNHAQTLLSESRRRWAGSSKHNYLLSGLIRCGICGNTMTGRRSKNWGKYVFEYTDVKNTAGTKNTGCRRNIKCEDLEEQVLKTVFGWLYQPEQVAAAYDPDSQSDGGFFEQAEITRIEKDLEKIKAGRKRLINLLAEGIEDLGSDEIREALKEMKDKEESLNQQLAELISAMNVKQDNEYSIQLLQQAADQYLVKNPDDLSFDEKKELIRRVVREIRVFEDRVEVYGF